MHGSHDSMELPPWSVCARNSPGTPARAERGHHAPPSVLRSFRGQQPLALVADASQKARHWLTSNGFHAIPLERGEPPRPNARIGRHNILVFCRTHIDTAITSSTSRPENLPAPTLPWRASSPKGGCAAGQARRPVPRRNQGEKIVCQNSSAA